MFTGRYRKEEFRTQNSEFRRRVVADDADLRRSGYLRVIFKKEIVMSRKLDGKVAIVTGASKGIGASIALHLAAEGASVVVNYSSSKQGADRIVGEINGNGGKAIAVQANLANEPDVRRLFAETKKAFGRLDILVNNAGVYEFLPLEQITADHYR